MIIKVKDGKSRRFEGFAGKSSSPMVTAPIEGADIIISIPDTFAYDNNTEHSNPFINFLINTGVTLNWRNKKLQLTTISTESIYTFYCGLAQVNENTYELRWVAKQDGNIIGSSNDDNSDVYLDFIIISQMIKPRSLTDSTAFQGNSYCCYNNFCINCGNQDVKGTTTPCLSFGIGTTALQIQTGGMSRRSDCYLMIGPDIDGIVDRDIVDIDEDITLMSVTLDSHDDDIEDMKQDLRAVNTRLNKSQENYVTR